MKKTSRLWLTFLLTLLVAALLTVGMTAAAEDADYNWQPLPTSPEGLAEGDYYLNYTGGYYNYEIQDIYLETGPDAQWYVDEDAMVLKGPYWYPPSGFTYTLKPETKPISAKYLVYRYLTRVGENWERIGAFDTGKTVRGYRLDFTALAEQVIAENDALTTNDSPALVNMWEQGEWFVDLNSRQLKGCFAVPDCFSQVWEEAYQILLPSQENFDLCVTNAVPQAVDISSMQGQWNDNISWKLENGTLTISGTGKMESQKRNRSPIHTSLNYHRQTISFSSNSYTDRDLLSPFLDYFCLAYFGYADFDVLDADLALGKIDFAQVLDYYDYLFHLVKTLVIEEGITEIDGGILGNVFPQTIILPSSLVRAGSTENYSRSAFSTNFTKDIYALNANLDFSTSSIPYCGFPLDHMPQSYDVLFNSYFEAGLSMMTAQQSDGITLYEDALKKICEIRAGKYENNYYESSMTEANILADWNYKTGMDIPTTDALIAEGIRVINNLFGSAFATLDDIFEIEKTEYSVYAERSDAYDAVYSAYYNELLEELLAQNPDYAIYMTFDASNLGQPLPTSESETELVPFPWFTIHGYASSTAETAAAASGVRFVPLCPTDPMHNVIEKDAVPAACTEAGHTAGFFCEDCGTWISGDAIDPTGHLHQTVLDKVLPRQGYAEHGHEAGVWCEDCNNPVSGCEVIHNQDGERTVIKEATETEEGEVIIVCTACGGEGLYALEKLEPQPEQPDDGNEGGGILDGLRRLARSIIDVFLRLIRWLGGKK